MSVETQKGGPIFIGHKEQLKEADQSCTKIYCLVLNSPYKISLAYGETMTTMTPYSVIGWERDKTFQNQHMHAFKWCCKYHITSPSKHPPPILVDPKLCVCGIMYMRTLHVAPCRQAPTPVFWPMNFMWPWALTWDTY